MMKKLSLIINILLVVAVAGLYLLYFTLPDITQEVQAQYEEEAADFPFASKEIVYVNIDSLMNNYDMFFDKQKEFLEKQQRMEEELNRSSRTYERQVRDFQDKVEKGLVTRSQAQQLELELTRLQQELMQQRDDFQRELVEEEQVMNRQLHHSIYDFLDEYNLNHNYQYILSYSFGGPLLYSDKNLNITKDVIEGLNRKYSERRQR